jgi:hypothetical protein
MKVYAIMATCGRHTLAERSLRFFLDQKHADDIDHKDIYHLIIYNNSPITLSTDPTLMEGVEGYKRVELINQHIDQATGEPYANLGAIYNDLISHIDEIKFDFAEDAENPTEYVIVHWDDDDIFLPNHLAEGMKGYRRALKQGKVAYKPEKSYYRHPGGIQLMGNNLEPSVFVRGSHIQKHKYSLTTSDQHMPWFNALLSENAMLIDSMGPPTLIYNWGDTDIPTFKTSGNAGHPKNFDNYRNFSKDHGDGILTPWREEDIEKYYNLVR